MKEYKKTFLEFIENNSFSVLICGLIFAGVLVGIYCFYTFCDSQTGKILFASGYIDNRVKMSCVAIFFDTFIKDTIYLIVIFLLGFWALAQPIEFIIPIFKGITLGATITQIYFTVGIKGFAIIILMVIPSTMITVLVIIVSSREAIRMSNMIAAKSFRQSFTEGLKDYISLYIKKFILLGIFVVFAAMIDSICNQIFGKFLL